MGATTCDEYREHVEKDSAFERRFQKVSVGEPSVDATVSILRGLRARYEAQREALDHVAEALRLDTGDRGLLSTLGMAGRDAADQLARMQDLWVEGAFTEAAATADHLIEDYESSVGRGTLRLLGPLAALVVFMAMVRQLLARRSQPASVDA